MGYDEPAPRAVVRIGIGASALREGSLTPALHRAIHEELLEELALRGQLVFTSAADQDRFIAAIRQLPPTLAKAWEVVLASRRVRVQILDPASEPGLDESKDAHGLELRLGPQLQLVLVDAAQAADLGVPSGEYSTRTPHGLVEIGRITTASRTATLLAARSALESPLREGRSREIEWEERIGPLSEASRTITIYDKYVGAQTARRYLYRRPSGDGLTWLVSRLRQVPGTRLRIITAAMPRDRRGNVFDEQAISVAIVAMLDSSGRGYPIELVAVPEVVTDARGRKTEKFGHDRHIRFGDRTALALGLGIQSFSFSRFPETITVARLSPVDARAREERAIRAASRPPPGGWLADARARLADAPPANTGPA